MHFPHFKSISQIPGGNVATCNMVCGETGRRQERERDRLREAERGREPIFSNVCMCVVHVCVCVYCVRQDAISLCSVAHTHTPLTILYIPLLSYPLLLSLRLSLLPLPMVAYASIISGTDFPGDTWFKPRTVGDAMARIVKKAALEVRWDRILY